VATVIGNTISVIVIIIIIFVVFVARQASCCTRKEFQKQWQPTRSHCLDENIIVNTSMIAKLLSVK
jgi:hypothetical protein